MQLASHECSQTFSNLELTSVWKVSSLAGHALTALRLLPTASQICAAAPAESARWITREIYRTFTYLPWPRSMRKSPPFAQNSRVMWVLLLHTFVSTARVWFDLGSGSKVAPSTSSHSGVSSMRVALGKMLPSLILAIQYSLSDVPTFNVISSLVFRPAIYGGQSLQVLHFFLRTCGT